MKKWFTFQTKLLRLWALWGIYCLLHSSWSCSIQCLAYMRHSLNTCRIVLYWFSSWEHAIQDWQGSTEFRTWVMRNFRNIDTHITTEIQLSTVMLSDICSCYLDKVQQKLRSQINVKSPDNFISQKHYIPMIYVFSRNEKFHRHWLLFVICFCKWLTPLSFPE